MNNTGGPPIACTLQGGTIDAAYLRGVPMASFSRRAVLQWDGDVTDGAGHVTAGSSAFTVAVTFPRTGGEPAGNTTPEELLAASHATCYGIGLRSLIGRRGGRARRVTVTATLRAEKGPGGIRIQSSHLTGVVDGLERIDDALLKEIARETEERCTVTIALRETVSVTSEIIAR
jgi:lipoyl-dependent peroxiredoxin